MRYKIKLKTLVLRLEEPVERYEKAGNPKAAFGIATAIFEQLDADQEHVVALFLNSQNAITGYKVISSGGQAATTIDMKILFRNALLFGAQGLIMIHNHPSGSDEPSTEDIKVTTRILKTSKILGIKFLDHIILCGDTFYSFSESSQIFK